MLEPVKRKNKCSILHLREQELSNGLKATVACRVDFNEQRMHRLNPHLSSSARQLQWEKLPDGFSQQSPQGDVSSAHSGFRRSSDMQLQYPLVSLARWGLIGHPICTSGKLFLTTS